MREAHALGRLGAQGASGLTDLLKAQRGLPIAGLYSGSS